jgi:RNA polymerase sigma-70 factor (ECF subfamily)
MDRHDGEELSRGAQSPREGVVSDARFAAYVAAGRKAWPAIDLSPDAFARYLEARSPDGQPPSLERAPDLYLACACLEKNAAAVAAFHASFAPAILAAALRVVASRAAAEDIVQSLSEHLFVATADEPARISQYEGRASLRGWLATIAKRAALNHTRNRDEDPHDSVSAADEALRSVVGPEVMLLKARYKSEFEAAIRDAMASLPATDRSILLLHFVDGVTLPQLASLNKTSRSTIARRLKAAREALHEETRRVLLSRLRLTQAELESVAALVRSQIDVSIAGALKDDGQP